MAESHFTENQLTADVEAVKKQAQMSVNIVIAFTACMISYIMRVPPFLPPLQGPVMAALHTFQLLSCTIVHEGTWGPYCLHACVCGHMLLLNALYNSCNMAC